MIQAYLSHSSDCKMIEMKYLRGCHGDHIDCFVFHLYQGTVHKDDKMIEIWYLTHCHGYFHHCSVFHEQEKDDNEMTYLIDSCCPLALEAVQQHVQ